MLFRSAASKGVKVELIVRGICCLKTGLPGIGDNITVRSIVGNYLEHCRIFYFENDGKPEYYCASADWMPRNLERRVEILFPVETPKLQEKLMDILSTQLQDTVKAHILTAAGTYEKVDKRGKGIVNAQLEFCSKAAQAARAGEKVVSQRTFIPETHHE